MGPSIESRFRGSLLGLAAGDALGARFEAQPADWIARRYRTAAELVARPPVEELFYTDDTQMAIGVAETLAECRRIDPTTLRRRFAANYEPFRGYGRGARRVLEAMQEGADADEVARTTFPGGSYGNGAAMRVAPVGLVFRGDLDRTWDEAAAQSLPTHTHPLGVDGARLVAVAVALAARGEPLSRDELLRRGVAPEYVPKIEAALAVRAPDDVSALGNGIAALDSVPTAIACFVLAPTSFVETIGRAVLLGGDTDTIAAMAGAISGAALGAGAIPAELLARLEDGPKGRTYIDSLARRLAEV